MTLILFKKKKDSVNPQLIRLTLLIELASLKKIIMLEKKERLICLLIIWEFRFCITFFKLKISYNAGANCAHVLMRSIF